MRTYYGALPLMSGEAMRWFDGHPKKSEVLSAYIGRYVPEQHIFLSFLRQYETIGCSCYYDSSPGLIRRTEKAFADCFVILDYQKQLHISFPKYNPNKNLEKYTLMSHWQWKACYERYCLKRVSPAWCLYLLRAAILSPVKKVRKIGVRFLSAVGLKETVKNWLIRRKSGDS